MTPQAAFQSEIFRTYVLIVAGILALAGLILSVLRFGFGKQLSSIWMTYRSWLIMAPLALGCVFAGRVPVIVFFCLLAGYGSRNLPAALACIVTGG
ncbi:MAG: hypothetical protein U1F83_12740 [Verrucomicrobiota bacterium]